METFTLSQPIQHGSEQLFELTLRDPTAKDVNDLGLPFKLDASLISEPVPAVCAKYISRLASIPPNVVEKIALSDYTMLRPGDALELPLSELRLYVDQWNRIQEKLNGE